MNGSDIVSRAVATGNVGGFIPFRRKEMRRRTCAEGAKLAHEMRLVSVSVGEREVRPRDGRAHNRLPPRPCEAGKPFETLRRHAHFVEKPPLQVSRGDVQFSRDLGNRDWYLGAKKPIDGTDDQIVGRLRMPEMLEDNSLDRVAARRRIDPRVRFDYLRQPVVERFRDTIERTDDIPERVRRDAEKRRRARGMQSDAERADVRWIPHLDRRLEQPHDCSRRLVAPDLQSIEHDGVTEIDHNFHIRVGQNRW
ncbi:MAG TPA: hypothetical protein VKE51_41130 [Vicinamibacterales bacterium]|nr:hypothetical protein [Vicinamibacterales bacterium]